MTRNGEMLRAIAQAINNIGGRVASANTSATSDGLALTHYAEQLTDMADNIDRFKSELVGAGLWERIFGKEVAGTVRPPISKQFDETVARAQ